ncbi:ribonuclease H-like domain-containing protein [Hygrophoropsis aurantiaca]|uniref:Ribonuclease H-like domain-containing protein n=1 Tax=Hygrophoropsis aurantiaca TaxID=72124 RepID=A0ACB8ATQ2_9AGAM|nr:ribonuclease H-like domain-containing protein [Hygrophoropsis aurantiaca]
MAYRSDDSDEEGEGIINRRFVLCSSLKTFEVEELTTHCPHCLRFFALCCLHPEKICHHFRMVFTDGACSRNGQADACSGMGIAMGLDGEGEDQWALPIDDTVDPDGKRTSQRAELLAASEGLRRICEEDREGLAKDFDKNRRNARRHGEDLRPTCLIIATDSQYVVKGMTEWLPHWKANGWRTSRGGRPSNIDLFQKLDAEVDANERRHHVEIGFWHVNREHNQLADKLAKQGARVASQNSTVVERTGLAFEIL